MIDELIYMVIFQKNGKAGPSVVATLIDRLPDENDPQRSEEEKIAQHVAVIAYLGMLVV